MSVPVEGKPGIRLVWWCVEHDEVGVGGGLCATGWLRDSDDCRVHRFELRPHGYEKIEWGEQ